MENKNLSYDLTTKAPAHWGKKGIILMISSFICLIILYFIYDDTAHFKFTYLSSFILFLSISLGGLIFIFLSYLFRASWSVVPRRIIEAFMKTLPLMAILFIPIFFFMNSLFAWTHHDNPVKNKIVLQETKAYNIGKIKVSEKISEKWAEHLEHVLHIKSPYLNKPFFIIRSILYFVIWGFLAFIFFKKSTDTSEKPMKRIKFMTRLSAPSIIIFALSVTFASFDWIMSLDYAWFSTIFGVIYFSTCMITILSSTILASLILQSKGYLKTLTKEHYHDLAKILYAFMIFFTYVAFSQLLLIWYADISEETYWYVNRWKYGWDFISLTILFGHFVIPFALFMSRHIKRNKFTLAIMAIWMLLISYIHIYWQILPNKTYPEPSPFHFQWIDIVLPIIMAFFYIGAFLHSLKNQFLIPIDDPKLEDSVHFQNY